MASPSPSSCRGSAEEPGTAQWRRRRSTKTAAAQQMVVEGNTATSQGGSPIGRGVTMSLDPASQSSPPLWQRTPRVQRGVAIARFKPVIAGGEASMPTASDSVHSRLQSSSRHADLLVRAKDRALLLSTFAAWRTILLTFSEAGLQTSAGLSFGRALLGLPDFSVGPYVETGASEFEMKVGYDMKVSAGRSTGADTAGPYTELFLEVQGQSSRSGMSMGLDFCGPFVNVYVSRAQETKGLSDAAVGMNPDEIKEVALDAATLTRDSADFLLAQASASIGSPSGAGAEHSADSDPAVAGPASPAAARKPQSQCQASSPQPLAKVCRKLSATLAGSNLKPGLLQHLAMPPQGPGPIVASDKADWPPGHESTSL
mmetsp:Transcript_63899/g.152408  ORF Transcript_63899/g.152408 Transcript_63899/m.152408 type:complete len:371 (+) Transcript_63899:39-1151(+)